LQLTQKTTIPPRGLIGVGVCFLNYVKQVRMVAYQDVAGTFEKYEEVSPIYHLIIIESAGYDDVRIIFMKSRSSNLF
jgi:hypothetical protein